MMQLGAYAGGDGESNSSDGLGRSSCKHRHFKATADEPWVERFETRLRLPN